ncbi:MAG TPA: endonuclease VIII [Woeseiaceae bacterium]|nr:endonuclease VIII [Woeseiaceae bacterium]
MPEGPEIRRAADRIARVLVDRVVEEVRIHVPDLARRGRRLAGHTVTAVDTRGKAMLTRFDNGLTLYSHNQLYGRWHTVRRPRMPQTERQLRVELHTATHSALLYSATDIEILTDSQVAGHPFLSRIGPDVMDPELTAEQVLQRLVSTGFRRRRIGSLLLDQEFLAGIGNYLRTEILFVSGIHPAQRALDLAGAELERLSSNAVRVARRSYRTGGVTVVPSLERVLKSKGQSFEERRFYVFGRNGEPCHLCGAEIERLTVGGRNLFLCPGCQPRRRA